jgi:hypothetical protein
VSVILMVSLVWWILKYLETMKSNGIRKSAWGLIALVLAELALSVWYLIPPLQNLCQPQWELRGTVQVRNPSQYCAVLFDGREREVSDRCISMDSIGWVDYSPEHRWLYKPQASL